MLFGQPHRSVAIEHRRHIHLWLVERGGRSAQLRYVAPLRRQICRWHIPVVRHHPRPRCSFTVSRRAARCASLYIILSLIHTELVASPVALRRGNRISAQFHHPES